MKPSYTHLLFLALSLSVLAQETPAPADRTQRLFDQIDANKDGKLAKEELPERLRPNFSRVDTDKDGFISRAEHQTVVGRSKEARPAPGQRPLPAGVEAKLDLAYAESDNPRQKLDLYLPKLRKTEKPLPVIIFIHGGGWRGGDKSSGIGNVGRFVASGEYAGVSVGYRLTNEAQWPAQIHDCKAAIRWVKAHAQEYGLDASKIGVWGTSAGGHLVSMLGTSGDVKELEGNLGKHLDQDSKVTCVVNFFGPENFLTMVRQPSTINRTQGKDYPEALLLGGPVPEREAVAKEASPVTHVSAGDAVFFTAHGTKDPLVPFAQGEEIHAALKKAGVPSILQEMTNGGHGFRSEVLDQRIQQFFNQHLRGVESEIETTPIAIDAK
ncbi:alpha/beta hydrolase fold domain-containing protein [Prosthecobacter dejongeii]|uniref:Acetyl esterase/lipase n=1 Tax=Prosthecobacter dejongeii TaxID=48465 RepID=A0A7W8DQB7_9BACT|nr:alpha/beta hydrolase fold domain-containing protein [Prosthecobacter dejongeii]MBB5038045.1 acetyl esterase/lipase [Prosthecobacter dejongeii]